MKPNNFGQEIASAISLGGAVGGTLASSIGEITEIPTAETDDTLVLAPDGMGGVEWRAEVGGPGGDASRSFTFFMGG